jgi:hypothetical protein
MYQRDLSYSFFSVVPADLADLATSRALVVVVTTVLLS